MMTPRFPLGKMFATRGAAALQIDLSRYLHRHHCGDWGDLCDEDKQANEYALARADRLLSKYELPNGPSIYVITEWDRRLTTILLTDEY